MTKIIGFILGLLMMTGNAFAAPEYTLIDLGTVGDIGYSSATDINDNGHIVGQYHTDSVNREAFLFANNEITKFPEFFCANAINNNGQMILHTKDGDPYLYDYEGKIMEAITDDSFESIEAIDINDNGQIVGRVFFYIEDIRYCRAFRYNPGESIRYLCESKYYMGSTACAINNNGHIAGYTHAGPGDFPVIQRAFLYDGINCQWLYSHPAFAECYGVHKVVGINSSGNMIGRMTYLIDDETFDSCCFFYGDADDPNEADSNGKKVYALTEDSTHELTAVNDHGQIIGGYWADPTGRDYVACLYEHGIRYDLKDLIVNLGTWSNLHGTAINNSGQIVGHGTINGLQYAILLDPDGNNEDDDSDNEDDDSDNEDDDSDNEDTDDNGNDGEDSDSGGCFINTILG